MSMKIFRYQWGFLYHMKVLEEDHSMVILLKTLSETITIKKPDANPEKWYSNSKSSMFFHFSKQPP